MRFHKNDHIAVDLYSINHAACIHPPIAVFLLLLEHLAHGVVVNLSARPEVGLGVGEEFVGAEVDDVEAADLGVVGPVHVTLLVVGGDVAVAPHQLVEHRRHRLRSHLGREGEEQEAVTAGMECGLPCVSPSQTLDRPNNASFVQ